jgi:arginyl-tRNA synthetase
MDNISNILSRELVIAFSKTTNFDKLCDHINPKLLNVQYFGKRGIDYSFKGLIGIQKILQKNYNINNTPQELFDELFCHLSSDFFDISYSQKQRQIIFNLNSIGATVLLNKMFSSDNLISTRQHKHLNIGVDYSSPNVAKDMHVGHLRSTIIGESLCRLLRKQGHDVIGINHIGDFGLPFGKIVQYMFEKYPSMTNSLDGLDGLDKSGELDEFTKIKDKLQISDLQEFYAKSSERFKKDVDFQKLAYKRVIQLQSGNINDPETKNVIDSWNFIKDISRKSYEEIYDRLHIKIDTEVGESFYQFMLPDVVNELKDNNMLVEDNGRLVINFENDTKLTVKKSDGGYTYDTTDLAAIRYRLVELGLDRVYYVVGSSQELHFKQIFEVAEKMGWKTDKQELHHIGFGLVNNELGKPLKTRDGGTTKLKELLDASLLNSEAIFCNKRKERKERGMEIDDLEDSARKQIIRSVAYSSIKYFDMSTRREKDYNFSYDKMLSLKGNTAVYLLYAYVRSGAIIQKAEANGVNIDDLIKNHQQLLKVSDINEIKLATELLRFPEIIDRVSNGINFHRLCDYLYSVSTVFSTFFRNCRCIEYNEDKETISSINYSRILMCAIFKKVMKESFDILNIEPLEKL